jgi:hypothetical protein
VLADLAADDTFRGVAVCEFLEEPGQQKALDQAAICMDLAHEKLTWRDSLETRLRAAATGRLVIANPRYGWMPALTRWSRGVSQPSDTPREMRADRSVHVDVRKMIQNPRYKNRPMPQPPATTAGWRPEDWQARADAQLAAAERIAERGGRVVFVRMPTSGRARRRTDRLFPRKDFWDRFAARVADVPGVEALHYQDDPTLRTIETPDEMHIDQADSPTFTAALVDELGRRGAL